MSRRGLRNVALIVLLLLLLSAAGVVAVDYVTDYRLYRHFCEALALPGEEAEGSLEEFVRFRRAIAFADAADRLAESNATTEEVRAALGEPDHKNVLEEYETISWFYSGPVFRGRRQPTIVLAIDLQSSRVTSISYITHN